MLRTVDDAMGPFVHTLLRRPWRRRLAAIMYAGLCLAIAEPGAWGSFAFDTAIFVGIFVIGGQFMWVAGRRARAFGMVKSLNDDGPDRQRILTLDLAGQDGRPETLDERERAERDHAHFVAYWIFAGVVFAVCMASVVVRVDFRLMQSLLMLALGMPAIVMLWTAPEVPGEPQPA